ncbi:MAG: hypothetical protein WCO56_05370 [Verrucomicrobiota bacterium]
MKSLLAMIVGGKVLATFLLFAAAAVLVLVVIPVGLGIFSLELERLKRGLRRALAFLSHAKPR